MAAHAPVDAPGPAWRPALASWLAPLAVSPPCGLDPAGHEVFDAARQQLARLSALTGDPVDWPRVEAAADTLLRTVARDLRPATWLALARSHRGDLHGLALGLRLIATLLDDHPEDLHPRRPKPRRDTLDWFFKQAALALAAVPTSRLTAADLDALDAARQHLGDALATRLPDAPSLRPLRDALLAARERLPEPAAPPPSAAPPSVADASPSVADPSAPAITPPLAAPSATSPPFAPTPPVAPSVVTAPPVAPSVVTAPPAAPPPSLAAPAIHTVAIAAPASSTELDRFLAATADALLETARLLREASPADPRAYRLLRTGLWIHLTSLPPPRPDGNTNVPGLDDRDRSQLADLAARAAWPGLLTRSENLLVRHRLALDLQRLTVAALDGLGHADAALAVRAELRALFTRLPGLLDLRDRDGQPLADAATRQWLSRTVLAAPADADSAEAPDWSALTPRLRGPDRMPALAEAQATIDAGASGRLRFTRRLGLAEALLPGDPALAHLLFAALADELDRGDIDAWDPTLAARCLASAARRPPPAIAPPAALLRLARVDIAAAAALLPSP